MGVYVNVKTGRAAKHYACAECKAYFPAKDVQVDHINPIVPTGGFTTWDDLIENLFCEADQMQCLCKPCHKIKTKQENTTRKINAK